MSEREVAVFDTLVPSQGLTRILIIVLVVVGVWGLSHLPKGLSF